MHFLDLFPDSEVAKNMQLGKNKMAYMIVYGISDHFKDIALEKILPSDHFVIGFDESFNKISQKQQLDVNVNGFGTRQSIKLRLFTLHLRF